MSSFFTVPRAQNKRKRVAIAEPPKKRIATTTAGGKARAAASAPRTNGGKSRNASKREKYPDHDEGGDEDDDDFEIDSDNALDSDDLEGGSGSGSDEGGGEGETAAEKRLRLAERYLENIKQDVREDYGFDAEEIDKEIIASRLEEDVAESKGKVYKTLSDKLAFDQASHAVFKTNTQAVTAVATHGGFAYVATKDLMLQKWRLQELPRDQYGGRNNDDNEKKGNKNKNRKAAPSRKQPERVRIYRGDRHKVKNKSYKGHTKDILTVAVSSDGKYVVTGGADHKIIVYESETLKPVRVFQQHRSGVTGLAFRRGTNQMYSCSRDRVVKVWSLDELAFVSSLFGHEEAVVDIAALGQERCVTVGSRDRTARYWKVVDEKQLVFRGGAKDRKPVPGGLVDPRSQAQEGSIDRVAMLDDELFVTGGDSGTLTLWSIQKKNPLFVIPRSHGVEKKLDVGQVSAERNPDLERAVPAPQPRWITALKAVPFSDLVISGSWDGFVRVWRLSEDKRRLEAVGTLGGPLVSSSDSQITNGGKGVNGVADLESSFEGLSERNPESKEPTPAGAASTPTLINPAASQASSQSKPQQLPPKKSTNHPNGFEIRGVINDLSVFERGNRGRDGLCVVAAVAKEHRFGRWMKNMPGAKNGGCVFEIPRIPREKPGVANGDGGDDDDEEE
ncbi:WD repeat domain-containing protein [Zalerion maritima]|uniref:WD repeat domain-containing protein n=1 Tax=Zalerion maritima TaxID=339359 RepID=A0AAD5RTQ2_9PEZI|nr:WD repeat domain-containing protein [Zalerion maritima]